MADLLETAGAPTALNWRVRAANLDPRNASKRFHWAELAIKENNLSSAAEALDAIDEGSRNTADYHKLKRRPRVRSARDAARAEEEYSAAARLDPENRAVQMNLATIRLESTNGTVAGKPPAFHFNKSSTNAVLHLNALRQLLADATFINQRARRSVMHRRSPKILPPLATTE